MKWPPWAINTCQETRFQMDPSSHFIADCKTKSSLKSLDTSKKYKLPCDNGEVSLNAVPMLPAAEAGHILKDKGKVSVSFMAHYLRRLKELRLLEIFWISESITPRFWPANMFTFSFLGEARILWWKSFSLVKNSRKIFGLSFPSPL